MSITYLEDRQHYEDRFDDTTIAICRDGERMVNNVFKELQTKLPASEIKQHKQGWYLQYSFMYFAMVESAAVRRHDERETTIAKWMAEDEAKDRRLAEAHIPGGTYCRNCGKDMRVISKDYMRRDGQKEDDILLLFECDACNKRYAFWQDGTEWEGVHIYCKKCGTEMESKHKTKGKVITTTRTCPKCGHTDTEIMDFTKEPVSEEEPADPYHELDKKRFVFDEEMMSKFGQKANHLERLRKLNATAADQVEHADIYDAVKDIKKLKIAQLSELLNPVLTKHKYSEFKLGEPQLGREVSLEFNCLDADADRKEYDSEKGLAKLIEKTLADTNWRLMSDGIHYRLGYLSGRLRAYESEEDLKKLVEQRIKTGKLQPKAPTPTPLIPTADKFPNYEGMQMREAVQVYMDKLTLGSRPAEITLKSGKVKPHHIPVLRGEMNPLLRVFIPFRDGDKSVPEFIRTFDFKFGPPEMPKVSKDKMGREIRLLDEK